MNKLKHIIAVLITVLTVFCVGITVAACKRHVDHTYGEWSVVKRATCTEKGQRERVCAECGDKQTEEIPLTEHKVAEYSTTKEPACVTKGEKSGKCLTCGQTVTVEINALGHTSANEWLFDDDTHWRQCERCQVKLDEAPHDKKDGGCAVCDWKSQILAELTYELLTDGTYAVTGYSNDGANTLIIPSEYNGASVTAVVSQAFWYETNITSLTIAEGITTLGDYAFGHTGIRTATIPDSVVECGEGVFQQCEMLEKVVLGRGLTETSESMFYQCGKLREVDIPETVTTIGKYTFTESGVTELHFKSPTVTLSKYAVYKAEQLSAVIFEEGVETIKVSVLNFPFHSCSNLTTMRFPSTLTSGLSDNLWSQMPALENIEVAENNPKYKSVGGILYNANGTSVLKVPSNKAGVVNVADGVTTIGSSAFWCCDKVTAINLPDGLTKINTGAFGYTEITEISFPDSVKTFGQDIFEGVTTLKKIHFGSAASTGVDAIMRNCYSLLDEISVSSDNEKYVSRNNVLLSKDGKTLYLSNAKASIPAGVEVLGRYAFVGNSALTKIVIPEGVHTVGGFINCKNLQEVTFSSTVKTIDNSAFSGCSSLTSVTIPASVTTVGQAAFYKCEKLQSVIFEDTSGWKKNDSSSSGAEVDVTNAQTNAQQLVNSNMRKYYKD